MHEQTTEGCSSAVASTVGLGLFTRIEAHIRQLAPHMQREGVVLLREARDEIDRRRAVFRVNILRLALETQHSEI